MGSGVRRSPTVPTDPERGCLFSVKNRKRQRARTQIPRNSRKPFRGQSCCSLAWSLHPHPTVHADATGDIASNEEPPRLHRCITKPSQQEELLRIHASYVRRPAGSILSSARKRSPGFPGHQANTPGPGLPPVKVPGRQLAGWRTSLGWRDGAGRAHFLGLGRQSDPS